MENTSIRRNTQCLLLSKVLCKSNVIRTIISWLSLRGYLEDLSYILNAFSTYCFEAFAILSQPSKGHFRNEMKSNKHKLIALYFRQYLTTLLLYRGRRNWMLSSKQTATLYFLRKPKITKWSSQLCIPLSTVCFCSLLGCFSLKTRVMFF